ncbi:MAG: NAD-dependent protein deacetylase [Deltaproteobacteria bacterium]|nr:NAD-dependent protein deacetylase [Deltaproteobacteria bacterium]
MGVDSGLPDFRGPEGFWRAYPAYAHLKLKFEDLANPRWFVDDATLAWGFYGHRRNLYRATAPHDGYAVLRRWCMRAGAHAAYTSNVDGALVKAGFEPAVIAEVHGAIDTMQCTTGMHGLWAAGPQAIDVDAVTGRARPPFPTCPRCGALARPNILMFGDYGWDDTRTDEQLGRLNALLADVDRDAAVVVVECGAGTHIPTVRGFSHQLLRRFPRATLVRINVREAQSDEPRHDVRVVSIAAGARVALLALDAALATAG